MQTTLLKVDSHLLSVNFSIAVVQKCMYKTYIFSVGQVIIAEALRSMGEATNTESVRVHIEAKSNSAVHPLIQSPQSVV